MGHCDCKKSKKHCKKCSPTLVAPQFQGSNFRKARKYCRIGVIQFDNEQTNSQTLAFPVMGQVADYYNVDKILFRKVTATEFNDPAIGVPGIVAKLNAFIAEFKANCIYRVVLPSTSSILGPFLAGTYNGGVRFELREPEIVAAVRNPGTAEVENNKNVWRFAVNQTVNDPLGELATVVYREPKYVLPSGKILLLYDNTPAGPDIQGATDIYNLLVPALYPMARVELFALIPDNLGSFLNWGAAAAKVAALPAGSLISIFSNQSVDAPLFLNDPGSAALFTNPNVKTYAVGNFTVGQPGATAPVQFEGGVSISNLAGDLPNAWSRRFGYPDTVEAALTAQGQWGTGIGTLPIEVIAWLATQGRFEGLCGDLKFPAPGTASNGVKYGQTRLGRDVVSAYVAPNSIESTIALLGLNSLYYDFVPGTFEILFPVV